MRPKRSTNLKTPPPGRYHWVRIFLATLSQQGSIHAAAEKANIDPLAVYRHRDRSPTFARYWDYALEKAADDLEAEIYRRAKDGIEKTIWYQGEQRGTEYVTSDTLAMFWLKGRRPNKYKDASSPKTSESLPSGLPALSEADRLKLVDRRRIALTTETSPPA